VLDRIGRDSRSGALFVFLGRQRAAIRILFFDGTGLCLLYKRLDRGLFRLPRPQHDDDRMVRMDEAALESVLDVVDLDVGTRSSRRRSLRH